MIWLWILLALAVTLFLLKDKNIEPHNFIWALLPIDKYGISVLGFIVKPIYLFSVIVVFFTVISKKFRLKLPPTALLSTMLFCIFVVLSTLLKNTVDILLEFRMYGMFIFTIICAAAILSNIKGADDLRQIQDVMIATAVGYGIVFVTLYALYNMGISLPDVVDSDLYANSIFNSYRNVANGELFQTLRLRGFFMDSNTSNIVFIVGLIALLGKWVKNGGFAKNALCFVVIMTNIILSSSRTALVTSTIFIVLSVFRMIFSKTQSRKKIIFLSILLFGLFFASTILLYGNNSIGNIYNNLASRYTNRSSLNDTYGRFTIWKQSLGLLFETNWYAGIGTGALQTIMDVERDSHNTVIEAFCSLGVFAGLYYTIYFLTPLVNSIKMRFTTFKKSKYLSTLIFMYIGILIMLTSVSNLTNTYLIHIALLLTIIPGCVADEEEKNSISESQEIIS